MNYVNNALLIILLGQTLHNYSAAYLHYAIKWIHNSLYFALIWAPSGFSKYWSALVTGLSFSKKDVHSKRAHEKKLPIPRHNLRNYKKTFLDIWCKFGAHNHLGKVQLLNFMRPNSMSICYFGIVSHLIVITSFPFTNVVLISIAMPSKMKILLHIGFIYSL